MFTYLHTNFRIAPSRQAKVLQRIDGFGRWIGNIDKAFVYAHFVVFTAALLVHVGLVFTVYLVLRVGSGTGPAMVAPVRRAVSIICFADWSMTLWSYAFRRIRIRCLTSGVWAIKTPVAP